MFTLYSFSVQNCPIRTLFIFTGSHYLFERQKQLLFFSTKVYDCTFPYTFGSTFCYADFQCFTLCRTLVHFFPNNFR